MAVENILLANAAVNYTKIGFSFSLLRRILEFTDVFGGAEACALLLRHVLRLRKGYGRGGNWSERVLTVV